MKNLFCGLLLGLVVAYSVLLFSHRREEGLRSELSELQKRLLRSVETPDTFYIRDSVFVWRDRVKEVDRRDYSREVADKQLIKALRLKISQIESESKMLLSVRDTVKLSSVRDSVKCYEDEWTRFCYDMRNDTLDYSITDSLTTYVSREYKHKFLWWRWGTKGYRVTHVNSNRRVKVLYNHYIQVR